MNPKYSSYFDLSSRLIWNFIEHRFSDETDRMRIVEVWGEYSANGTKELTKEEEIAFLKEIGMME